MRIIETLIEQFPVRKTKSQKEAFRAWAVAYAQGLGYDARVEKKGSSHNIVIGDPETAEAVFTGHYDTPPVMPFPNFITPCNILSYIGYQLLLVPLILLPGILLGAGTGFAAQQMGMDADAAVSVGFAVGYIMMFATLGLMMFGPANKHNVNDNTSGVAAVLELMARIPEENRAKAAFILFDNEEKGMLGSSAYAAMHKGVRKEKLLINMDCVGDGEHILFLANRRTRALDSYGKLTAALEAQTGRELHLCRMEQCVYPSDQSNFRYGVAVCACNRMKVIGYYCDKIHTKKDTICEQRNLDFLADGLAMFVASL